MNPKIVIAIIIAMSTVVSAFFVYKTTKIFRRMSGLLSADDWEAERRTAEEVRASFESRADEVLTRSLEDLWGADPDLARTALQNLYGLGNPYVSQNYEALVLYWKDHASVIEEIELTKTPVSVDTVKAVTDDLKHTVELELSY